MAAARVMFAVAASLLCTSAPVGAQGPFLPAWTVSGEAGGVAASTWLHGARAPRVASKIGFEFGVSGMRSFRESVAAGATIRAIVQPLELRENAATWSGGTLAQYDVTANVALRLPALATIGGALELGGGAAVLTGANEILPFSKASRVAPLAEIGAAVKLGGAASRRALSLVIRYGVVRMTLDDAALQSAPGWVPRLTAGVRVSR